MDYIIHQKAQNVCELLSQGNAPKAKEYIAWAFFLFFPGHTAMFWVRAALSVWVLQYNRGEILSYNQPSDQHRETYIH